MIAICVGHSRPGDSGAASITGTTEHAFNTDLGRRVVKLLAALDHPAAVINSYQGTSYTPAMRWLGRHLKDIKASLAIELHFNSSDNSSAQGMEYLHHQSSRQGEALARSLIDHQRARFAGAVSRGLKPIGPRGRGWGFLDLTPCPAAICEPFFGSSPTEWARYSAEDAKQRLAESYAAGIVQFLP